MPVTRGATKNDGSAAASAKKTAKITVQQTKKRTRVGGDGEKTTQVIRDQISTFETDGPPGKKRKTAQFKDKQVKEKQLKTPASTKSAVRPAKPKEDRKNVETAAPSSQLLGELSSAAKRNTKRKPTEAKPQQSSSKAPATRPSKRNTLPEQYDLLPDAEREICLEGQARNEDTADTDYRWQVKEAELEGLLGLQPCSSGTSTVGKRKPAKPSAASLPTPSATSSSAAREPSTSSKNSSAEALGQNIPFSGVRKSVIMHDDFIKEHLVALRIKAEELASTYFRFQLPMQTKDKLTNRLKDVMTPELQRIVGCVAVGGPGGAADWAELFSVAELRMALVIGVIGTVLKECAFGVALFGASEKELAILKENELRRKDGDGKFSPGLMVTDC